MGETSQQETEARPVRSSDIQFPLTADSGRLALPTHSRRWAEAAGRRKRATSIQIELNAKRQQGRRRKAEHRLEGGAEMGRAVEAD
jgi:hypothetical protein